MASRSRFSISGIIYASSLIDYTVICMSSADHQLIAIDLEQQTITYLFFKKRMKERICLVLRKKCKCSQGLKKMNI